MRNVDDKDVENCLSLLTFLPLDEVKRLGSLEGSEINKAKEVLAFEVTKMVHSEEDALGALKASQSLFGGSEELGDIPSTDMNSSDFSDGKGLMDLMREVGLIKSNSEGRRLIEQGGISLNGNKVEEIDKVV